MKGGELEQIKVKITRIISPAEFCVKIENRSELSNRNEVNVQSSSESPAKGTYLRKNDNLLVQHEPN